MTFIRCCNNLLKPHMTSLCLYNQNNNLLLMQNNDSKYQNFTNDYFKSMSLEHKIAYYLRVPVIGPSPHLFLIIYFSLVIILNMIETINKFSRSLFTINKKKN